ACHSMDASFWTLGLGYPTRIEPESTKLFGETAPAVSRITYTLAAKGNRPEVKVVWRDGSLYPPRPKEVTDPALWPFDTSGQRCGAPRPRPPPRAITPRPGWCG